MYETQVEVLFLKITTTIHYLRAFGQFIKVFIFNNIYLFLTDIAWKREWFTNLPRFPKSHWESLENCRRFMDELAVSSSIASLHDWNKITIAFISHRGGKVRYLIKSSWCLQGLLHKYEGSMKLILKKVYENSDWTEVAHNSSKNPSAETVSFIYLGDWFV